MRDNLYEIDPNIFQTFVNKALKQLKPQNQKTSHRKIKRKQLDKPTFNIYQKKLIAKIKKSTF